MGLTQRIVDSARYAGNNNSADVRWDDDPVGFGLRVFPSGRKSFVLSYRTAAGLKQFYKIGDAEAMHLARGRKLAKEKLVEVANGANPQAERRGRRLEARTGTVEAMFRAYVAAQNMKRPDAVLWYGTKFIYAKFGARPWRDVRRSEVREWHASIKSPYNANRALQALRAAFYWRLWQEDDSPGQRRRESDTRNPCAGIALRPEKIRQVRLELAELPRLEAAIESEVDDPYLRAFFRFVLATGCRRGEALTLKWADVALPTEDGQGTATVTFRDTKSGADHTVPLSGYAAAQLESLDRVKDNPYVFVGRELGGHVVAPYKAWQRVREVAGLSQLRIHDLRRTFGSWLGDAGFTSKQIGTTLGHKSDITSRVYMALGDQSKRAATDAIGKLLTTPVQPTSEKVVKLPRARA
jgi:integrase